MLTITTKKILILPVLIAIASIAFFSIHPVTAAGPLDLTGLDNFGILAHTYTNSNNPNTLNGDLGFLVPNATPLSTHNGITYVGTDTVYTTAQANLATLYTAARTTAQSGACTFSNGAVTAFSNLTQPLQPGVYCIGAAASIGTSGITLSGNGVYIFRINGTLTTVANSHVTLTGGANANDVFWAPTGATTLESDTTFSGNILMVGAATTLKSNVALSGRILSDNAVTTTGPNDVITIPSSVAAPVVIRSNDCTADCAPPTLGLDSDRVNRVDQGFSYNGLASSIESFSTSYPVLTTKVGAVNKAVFKIYEEGGPSEVRHLEMAFGLAPGQIFSDSQVIVQWDKSWGGVETTNVVDPAHALKDVSIVTSEGPCKANSVKNDCLIVTIYHTFAAPLEFNGVAVNAWDDSRNAWQNRLTNGVIVLGDSQNPAAKHVVFDTTGRVSVITELTSHIAIDKLGKYWSLEKDGFWIRAFTDTDRNDVLSYWSGYDRKDLVSFEQMKKGQALIAKGSWDSSRIQTSPLHIVDAAQNYINDRDTAKFSQMKTRQALIAKGHFDSSAIQNTKSAITDRVPHIRDDRTTASFEQMKKDQALKAQGYFDSSEIQNQGTSKQSVSPATTYCLEHGGKIKIQGTGGLMQSSCIFPNGSQCEEGSYFRGECTPKKTQ